ncbi:MAG: hypothetical protein P1P76_09890 [Anaerolineales bacterium]|nr:hypothetical protein [Anaerolineales bacterium]
MGEVQERVGKSGSGGGEWQQGESEGKKQNEENEVARGVIQRIRRGEDDNECRREAASTDFHDEELDVPNLEVPDNR